MATGEKNAKLVYSTATGDLRKSGKPGDVAPVQAGKGKVRVSLDTKGRRGKAVTLVSGIQHNPQVIEDLAKTLKNYCGAGGTVEGRDILIQGDHREKILAKLSQLGYTAS
jgi:translation initiation factor 1